MGRKIPETITEEELIKLVKATPKDHHRLAYYLGFYGCMRVSEVVHLQPENIDKGQKLIRIKQAKGSKDRNIPIHPKIFRVLQTKKFPIKCGIRALQMAFKKKGKEVLGKDIHFHTLRHSGATFYLNVEKWSTRKVQVMLGHARVATTEIYTHVTPLDLIEDLWSRK